MKPFNRQELIGVVLISLVVFSATWFNLKVAIRRSRDAQRKADLGAISDALGLYNQDFGFFPPSDNGKIKACKADNFDEIVSALSKETFSLNKFFEGLRSCD